VALELEQLEDLDPLGRRQRAPGLGGEKSPHRLGTAIEEHGDRLVARLPRIGEQRRCFRLPEGSDGVAQ